MKPYCSREVAELIGVSLETFYERRKLYHTRDGLPEPLAPTGRLRFDRASIHAWLGRFHPLAPKPAANDSAPLIAETDVESWRSKLYEEYRRA